MPKALDSQLDLKGQGLLVAHVAKDGPADKAGIEANDILLAVNDKPLKQASDLESALTEGKEISLKVLRGGKPQTITVTPAKRETAGIHWPVETEEIERVVVEKLKDAGISDFSIDLVQPGRFEPLGIHFGPELPDDVSVAIRKQGKNPPEVEVKRGDQTWTVKDGDVSSLPEDLRKPVAALLGHAGPFVHGNLNLKAMPRVVVTRPPHHPNARPAPPAPPTQHAAPEARRDAGAEHRQQAALEKNIDELRQRP